MRGSKERGEQKSKNSTRSHGDFAPLKQGRLLFMRLVDKQSQDVSRHLYNYIRIKGSLLIKIEPTAQIPCHIP